MTPNKIGFNKPYISGNELAYISDVLNSKHLSGNGKYTSYCQKYFQDRYGFRKCLLTTSCTDALEMAALLIGIEPGDEVIVPSYTFTSTANAFVLFGAKVVFADSNKDNPNIDVSNIEKLITSRTKAIIPVHYAGVACDMDVIMEIAERCKIFVIEDAAQAIDSYYTGKDGIKRPLGSIGHLAAFSFHETKNIISGEGGMLVVNDPAFEKRAEIIWEKGTNRCSFSRGEVDKYNWVDVGSSFLPSEIIAAFLWAQLEKLDDIQSTRKLHWDNYYLNLSQSSKGDDIQLPVIQDFATNNGHLFYIVCENLEHRSSLILKLKAKGIIAIFHYLSLHQTPFYIEKNGKFYLSESERYADCLLRLPMYYELQQADIRYICDVINDK